MQRLIKNLAAYRLSVDALVARLNSSDQNLAVVFLNVARTLTDLYANYLGFRHDLPALYRNSQDTEVDDPDSNVSREMAHRRMLSEALSSNETFARFQEHTSHSLFDELRIPGAYLNSLSLHLPEMYEESYQSEELAKFLLSHASSTALTLLDLSLQHLCHNHLLFALPALEELSNSDNWH